MEEDCGLYIINTARSKYYEYSQVNVVYIMNTARVVYNMNTARSKCGWVLFNIWCAMCWDE